MADGILSGPLHPRGSTPGLWTFTNTQRHRDTQTQTHRHKYIHRHKNRHPCPCTKAKGIYQTDDILNWVAYIESYCCRQTLWGQIMSLIPSCLPSGKSESFCHYWRRNNTFNTCGKNSCPSLARHSKSQVAGGSFKGGPLKELLFWWQVSFKRTLRNNLSSHSHLKIWEMQIWEISQYLYLNSVYPQMPLSDLLTLDLACIWL